MRISELWRIDPELGEALQPGEEKIACELAAFIARDVSNRFLSNGSPARRDVHSRAHGCVRATFKIEESLPAQFAQGVFLPGASYAAWIRFSNFDPSLDRPDAKGDVRAMAIKLLNVRDSTFRASERRTTTQDFILIDSPVFAAYDVRGYLAFIKRQASWNPVARVCAPLALGVKGAAIGLKMESSRIGNPLAVRYWSAVPFRLGEAPYRQVVKYTAVPRCAPVAVPKRAGPRFLREAMIASLRTDDALFDFLVQPRTSSDMSVEDSRVEWKEAQAPFYRVATITIPRQTFDTAERDSLAENLAFNPWHALPEHRPIGCINRTRRVVYETIADLRRRFNGVSLREPIDERTERSD